MRPGRSLGSRKGPGEGQQAEGFKGRTEHLTCTLPLNSHHNPSLSKKTGVLKARRWPSAWRQIRPASIINGEELRLGDWQKLGDGSSGQIRDQGLWGQVWHI